MKIVLAGAFGNLGAETLKAFCAAGHEVVAADLSERAVEGTEGRIGDSSFAAYIDECFKA